MRITPDPIAPPAIGEQFSVSVRITAGENVGGYQISLAYEPTALRYIESANGDYLPTGSFFVPPVVSENTVKLRATSLAGSGTGDGTLATVTFEVLDVKESVIDPFDVLLTDSEGEGFALLAHSARVDPAALPTSAVVRLSPASVVSPAVDEQLTFNVDIVGGQDVADYNFTFDADWSALKWVGYQQGTYHIDADGAGEGDGTLGTVTYQVVDVKASTVRVSGYLVASNKLRHLPTFESAAVTMPTLGDVNSDGVVDQADFLLVVASLDQPVPAEGHPADVNEDGKVDIADLVRGCRLVKGGSSGTLGGSAGDREDIDKSRCAALPISSTAVKSDRCNVSTRYSFSSATLSGVDTKRDATPCQLPESVSTRRRGYPINWQHLRMSISLSIL